MVQKQGPNTEGQNAEKYVHDVISVRLESARDHSEVPSRLSSSLESIRDYLEVLSRFNSRLQDLRDCTEVTVDPTEDSIPDPGAWSVTLIC
jgi:hypothetical protein